MAAPTGVTTPAGDPAWLVTGYNTVQDLLADTRLGRSHADPDNAARYSDAAIFVRAARATGTPESEQAEHMLMRRLRSRSFSARRLAHLNPRIQELVDALLDGIEAMPRPVDLHETLSFPLPTLVICELLGVPYGGREDFRRWSDVADDMTDRARSRAGLERLQAYLRRLLDRKRSEPTEDVLSDLLAVREFTDGAFTVDKIVDLAVGLLFAGHETTVSAIDRGVMLLLAHPAQLAALKRDPALGASAVEEVLRFPDPVRRPPADHATRLARYANAGIELDGTTITAGDLVLLDLGGANLDPATFPDPERFDITRKPNPHVTFGYGPRFCLGAPVARLELRAVFGTLFARFPRLRLAVPVEDLQPRHHLLTGGLAALPVTW